MADAKGWFRWGVDIELLQLMMAVSVKVRQIWPCVSHDRCSILLDGQFLKIGSYAHLTRVHG